MAISATNLLEDPTISQFPGSIVDFGDVIFHRFLKNENS